MRSGSSTGQGWAFTHDGACWLATAGHVIHEGAGILITGANGVQGQGVVTCEFQVAIALEAGASESASRPGLSSSRETFCWHAFWWRWSAFLVILCALGYAF